MNDATCGKVQSCLDCPYPDVPPKCLDYAALGTELSMKLYVTSSSEDKPLPRVSLEHGFEWSAVYNTERDMLNILLFHEKQFVASIDIGETRANTNVSVSVGIIKNFSLKNYVKLSGVLMRVNYSIYSMYISLLDCGRLIKKHSSKISINEFHAICDDLWEKEVLEIARCG